MKMFCQHLSLWLLVISVNFVACLGTAPPVTPNILLLVVDDLRPDLGCYGQPVKTPNIDQLAARSIKFTNVHAQQALCAPSRASFLTSRRPDSTRVYDLRTYWRESGGNFTTIPQYFKESGYYTASVGKVFHHGKASNFTDDSPYSWSAVPYHPPTQEYKRAKVCLDPDGSKHENLLCPVNVSQQPGGTLPDIQSAEYAIAFIRNISENHESSRRASGAPQPPFFMAVGFHKPHIPFKFPREFLDLYPLETIKIARDRHLPPSLPKVAFEPYSSIREREDIAALNLSFPYGPVPDKYHRLIRQHYYAATSYTDSLIGHVLHALEETGFVENTIIVLLGDHGWQLGEHSEFAKFSNYGTATRVPLLIHLPSSLNMYNKEKDHYNKRGNLVFHNIFDQTPLMSHESQGGHSSDRLVELVDVFPTLCELAGLPKLKECPADSHSTQLCTEGASLVPLIKSALTRSELMMWKNCSFSQYPRPSDTPQNDTDIFDPGDLNIMGYTLRTEEYRYAEWVGFDPVTLKADWSNVHAKELYDLLNDPDENKNVAHEADYKDIVAEFAKDLRTGWKACVPMML